MANPDLVVERSAEGYVILLSPSYTETGFFNSNMLVELGIWNRKTKAGYVFDSSTGFTLPNTAVRSPEASLVLREKWDALPKEEKRQFAHLCPDFVIEILSTHDDHRQADAKMKEWTGQGAALGWLVDFDHKRVWVYTREGAAEHPFEEPLIGTYPVEGFQLSLPAMME